MPKRLDFPPSFYIQRRRAEPPRFTAWTTYYIPVNLLQCFLNDVYARFVSVWAAIVLSNDRQSGLLRLEDFIKTLLGLYRA